jgi:LmbE family N-acetylglucosaminyl deacetylase
VNSPRVFTVVALHAHPDDETLLTGGTLARLAAEGHRAVVVVATLGEAGLAASPQGAALAARRWAEVQAAARHLGCARVAALGYGDSGLHGEAEPTHGPARRFIDVAVGEAATRVADILREEHADVLLSYDRNGGYGHPDHRQVHHVGAAAAALAGTPLVLQATIDRTALKPLLALRRLAGHLLPGLPLGGADTAFTARPELTHCVDVRPYLNQKRAALRAHASQTEGGGRVRTVSLLSRLPGRLFAAVAGREWFVEVGRAPSAALADDILDSLR